MTTDISETIARWKSSIPNFDLLGEVSGNFVASYKDARALLDAAEAGVRARDAALEEAAALIEPGPSPCDCITMLDEWHVARCDCSNGGDTERAAEWCADKNNAARIRALKGRPS